MRRKKKSVGKILFEELFKVVAGLVVAVIAGVIAYNVVVAAFAEAARQTVGR